MSVTQPAHGAPALTTPVSGHERIQALDVVRGFALIGIFLMNIEWFNRPIAELGMGIPASAQGADWWASYLIYVLVVGKFWTMFSLLFGMGFAVMLTRAERAGRSFLVPYMRRIAALAVFGAAHHIFLWGGDILFSYAVAALCLMLLLWARWWALLAIIGALLAVSAIGMQWAGQVMAAMLLVAISALYLHNDSRIRRKGPYWSSLVFYVGAAVAVGFALVAGLGPIPADARWPAIIIGTFLLVVGILAGRYKDPVEARPRRLGVVLYLAPFTMMLAFGLFQFYGPAKPKPTEAQVAAAMVEAKADEAREKAGLPPPKPDKAEKAKAAQKSPMERAAMGEARRRLNRAEQDQEVATERRLQTTGTYGEFVRFRAREFGEHAANEFGFATVLIGMFLLGYWFVRKGIMERPAEHLPLFRKLAVVGLPLGVGLGVAGSLIATGQNPSLDRDPFQIASGLMYIGNLPACLGYVSLIVLMLHSGGALSRISVLAPLGRMALTNYLTHSLVSSMFFFGYGLGNWGMGRAMQVGFVLAVIVLQIAFCHWWLARFRFGPMEWLWRAITYWQLPPMRRGEEPVLEARAVA